MNFVSFHCQSSVDPPTTFTMLWRHSLSLTGQTHFYDNKLSNCPLSFVDASHKFEIHVSVRLLTISQWASENFCSYRKNLNLLNRRNSTGARKTASHVLPREVSVLQWYGDISFTKVHGITFIYSQCSVSLKYLFTYVWIYENGAGKFEPYHSYFTLILLLLEAPSNHVKGVL